MTKPVDLPADGTAHRCIHHDAPTAVGALPINWHRRVMTLAFPIVLGNLTQPILGIVDTAVAGHLSGAQPLGGVALGGLFFNIVFWGFGFLRMGTTGLVAQSFGAGDRDALRDNLMRAMALAMTIGIGILALQWPLMHNVLRRVGGSDIVQENAREYCAARIWAAPLVLLNYVILGYLLGRQQARLALLIQVFINAVNMVAVLLYVYGFNRGIGGIGAATATADAFGFVLGAALLIRLQRQDRARQQRSGQAVEATAMGTLSAFSWRRLLDRDALRRLTAINRDILLRTLCLLASLAAFAHLGARQGDTILAANALLLNFQTFMSYGLDGFAHAAEALVGAAVGARRRDAFNQAVRITLLWSVVGALLLSAIYGVLGERIIAQLTSDIAIRASAIHYLGWVVVLPIASVSGFLLDGVFIGATCTRQLMKAMALSLGVFALTAWLLVPHFGNHGLWLAFTLFMVARGVMLALQLPGLANRIESAASR